MPYDVELGIQDGKPSWSCSCPVGEDGSFCKHCVAVALVAGADVDSGGDDASRHAGRDDDARLGGAVSGDDRGSDGEDDVRAYLDALPAERLVDLLGEQVAQDWRLRERLVAEASAATGRGVDVATWRRRIEAGFDGGDFVPYAEAAGWAAGVDEVLDGLYDVLAAGHADAVVVLAEHAHRLADEAVQYVDDSDGWLSGISERIGDLHRRACEEGNPDPVELAGRLVDLELTSELDAFHRAAAHYADVLGAAGITEYRRLVEPRWRALGPADDPRDANWTDRYRAREAMMGVALATGDPEQVIEVKGATSGCLTTISRSPRRSTGPAASTTPSTGLGGGWRRSPVGLGRRRRYVRRWRAGCAGAARWRRRSSSSGRRSTATPRSTPTGAC